MKSLTTSEWELVTETMVNLGHGDQPVNQLDRLPVPGGWLYRNSRFAVMDGEHDVVTMVFVPDVEVQR
jgi:hypothetical protein